MLKSVLILLALIACSSSEGRRWIPPQPSGGGGFDTDAQAYFNEITTNGGTISSGSKTAVNTFFVSAKANGYYSKLVIFSLIVGNQLAAAEVQYQPGTGASAMTTSTFVGGDYTEATGVQGDGSTKYFDTGYNPSTSSLSPTSAGIWIYVKGQNTTFQTFLGNMTGGAGSRFNINSNSTTAFNVTITDNSNPATIGSIVTGMWGGTSNGSTTTTAYVNGSSSGGSTGLADSTFANNTIWLGGVDFGGSVYQPTNGEIRFYAITTGMSSTDASNFYNDVLAFETSLGRN